MPLLLVDLDNTLVDRAAAFAAFARDYATRLGRPGEDAAWLVETDDDGFTPRDVVAEAVRQRFGLDEIAVEELVAVLRAGLVERLELDPAVPPALVRARAAGWPIVIVTNGAEHQQQRKIDHLELRPFIDGVVVSEAVGVRKPDAEIFRIAARTVGGALAGAWMVGDSAAADIRGAVNAGIDSVWLSRGRGYPADQPAPTAIAGSFTEAVDLVLSPP